MDALKAQGIYENSIIVFSTDNGGPANGVSRNTACNYPLRGTKYSLWEGEWCKQMPSRYYSYCLVKRNLSGILTVSYVPESVYV